MPYSYESLIHALADAGIAHEELSTTAEVEPLFCFVPYDQPARVPDTFSAGKVTFAFSQTADARIFVRSPSMLFLYFRNR